MTQSTSSSDPHTNQLVFAGSVACSRNGRALQPQLLCDPAAGGWPGPLQLGATQEALLRKGLCAHTPSRREILLLPSKNTEDTPLHEVDPDVKP